MLSAIKPALALLAATLVTPAAFGQSTTLMAQQDSTIYEDATGSLASGVGQFGFTGTNAQGAIRRFFIQFDIAGSIPAGATITSARLELDVVQLPPSYQSDTYGAHRALSPWGEGPADGFGSGAPAQAGDATWLHTFFPGTFWNNAGGDFAAVASGSTSMNSLSRHAIDSAGLAADVQDFLDNPGNNFGWLIKSVQETPRTARGFGAREFALIGKRPALIVNYTTSTSITSFCDPASNNSSGNPAVLTGSFGSGVGSDLHLDVSGGPLPFADGSRQLGYFLVGNLAQPGTPVSDGLFCLIGSGAQYGRYNVVGTTRSSASLFDAAGNLENMVGTGGTSGYGFDVPSEIYISGVGLGTITAGDTYHFQAWFRDTLSGSGRSNFTNGLSVNF